MVVIEYVKDRKGMASRGFCSACLTTADEDDHMVRIKFYDDKSGFQMHRFNLCQKCYRELKDAMMRFEEEGDQCQLTTDRFSP